MTAAMHLGCSPPASDIVLLSQQPIPVAQIQTTHVDKIVGTPQLMKEKPTMVTESESDKSNNK